MFGTEKQIRYFRISGGKIITGRGDDQQEGNILSGRMVALSRRIIKDTAEVVYDLDLEDQDGLMRITLFRSTSYARSILRSIRNIDSPGEGETVIRTWGVNTQRGVRTNASVEHNGEKLIWAPLPEPSRISNPDGSSRLDYTDVYKATDIMAEEIRKMIARPKEAKSVPAVEPAAQTQPEVDDPLAGDSLYDGTLSIQ